MHWNLLVKYAFVPFAGKPLPREGLAWRDAEVNPTPRASQAAARPVTVCALALSATEAHTSCGALPGAAQALDGAARAACAAAPRR
jgi:hypothetical protein